MPGESGDKLTLSDCPQTYVKKKIIRQYCYNNFHKQFLFELCCFHDIPFWHIHSQERGPKQPEYICLEIHISLIGDCLRYEFISPIWYSRNSNSHSVVNICIGPNAICMSRVFLRFCLFACFCFVLLFFSAFVCLFVCFCFCLFFSFFTFKRRIFS